ncbi:hypothetical protein [Psychroserpens algicola]|uniref:Uncharacterized protein n=1 Tax=Psychroserpens algicola TaxID=1719034 RepID=A0ABT0H8V2_9FLAO|nr:hypothetical protein [Psychroserpens algicola]MCK8480795.1 hypothetical protein [Psychroserpens algicola]
MQLKKLNTAFIITTGVSVIVFVYLVFLGYDEIKTLKDVIKIIASILFPIPLLFFVRFILIEHFLPENTDAYKLQHQKPATILLVVTIIIGVVSMQGVEWVTGQKLEDHLIFAHLINSTTISSYVLNYILYNNLRVNGILSGVLLSLAIHVFFLTA